MFELLQQIIRASRERSEVCELIQQQLSLPPSAHVHVRQEDSPDSVQTVITVIEPESIRTYRIAKAATAITSDDVGMLRAG